MELGSTVPAGVRDRPCGQVDGGDRLTQSDMPLELTLYICALLLGKGAIFAAAQIK